MSFILIFAEFIGKIIKFTFFSQLKYRDKIAMSLDTFI